MIAFTRIGTPKSGDIELDQVAEWARHFLPHAAPGLGRSGAVCPYSQSAMDAGKLYIGRFMSDTPAHVRAVLDATRARYALLPMGSRPSLFASIIVAPRDVADRAAFVLNIQRQYKAQFLSDGLMLGEFFPSNPKSGVRSPKFFPLRTPAPALVVREMVDFDIAFLAGDDHYASAYVARFGAAASLVTMRSLIHGGEHGAKLASPYIDEVSRRYRQLSKEYEACLEAH